MVAISPISFGLVNISVAKWVTLLSVSSSIIMVVYTTISIIGAWQVFANVAITFERMNIFTCGKKQMVAWIKAVTGGGLGPGQGPNNHRRAIYARVLLVTTRPGGMIKNAIFFYPVFSAIADGKPGTT